MATSPDLQEGQIAAARAQAWHQAVEPEGQEAAALLTAEAARTFVEQHGLVLFAPRTLGAPASSLVEATLGSSKPAASAADADTARALVARLIAEGSAVPLNLLGGPGDTPDFVVSTSAFPFVFTLRGDKGWKRPPETAGAVKVTPLALRIYELLSEKGDLTAAEIVAEVGREVTESAVTRALGELWALLRVLPMLQPGAGETRWELSTTRYGKAIKAGANAGQPTALSGLVSLYLRQVLVATEEEIASFLSPLTARSRVRDVLHGLVAARQLSEGVLEGKTVLFIPENLPDLSQYSQAEPEGNAQGSGGPEEVDGEPASDGEGHIRQFKGGDGAAAEQPRKLRGKPATREDRPNRPAFAKRAGSRQTGGFAPREGGRFGGGKRFGADRREGDRRDRSPRGERPSFSRPWDEERRPRPAGEGGEERPQRPRPFRSEEGSGDRPLRREGTGSPRPFRNDRFGGDRRGTDRPGYGRQGGDRPANRDFPRRPRSEGGEFDGSGFAPSRRRDAGESRPPRFSGDRGEGQGSEGGERPYRGDSARGPQRPPRSYERPFRAQRPPRPADQGRFGGTERPEGRSSPERTGDRRPPRPGGGFSRPRPDREGGGEPRGPRPDRPFAGRPFQGGERRGFGGPPREQRGPGGPRSGRPQGDFRPRPERPQGEFRPRPGGGQGGFRSRGDGPGGEGARPGAGGRGDRPFRPAGRPGFSGGKPGFGRGPAKGAGPRRTGDSRPPRPRPNRPEDEA